MGKREEKEGKGWKGEGGGRNQRWEEVAGRLSKMRKCLIERDI